LANFFEQLKITRELFSSNLSTYDEFYNCEEKSAVDDIKAAITPLIPCKSGHELIRLGGNKDGAYLVPDDLEGIEACFSPGVNNFKDFEDVLARRYGIKSFMCDYSSDAKRLKTPLMSGLQYFDKKWLDVSEKEYNLDINQWTLLNTTADSDLMLQIDIEGAEYRNILHASKETLSRFRMIVIELHSLYALKKSEFLNGIFIPTINKISTLFTCVHTHPNNCCGSTFISHDLTIPNILELTFLRNDRLKKSDLEIVIPNPLDEINVPNKPPIHLRGLWLKNASVVSSELLATRQSLNWLEYQMLDSNKKIKKIQNELNIHGEYIFSHVIKNLDQKTNIAIGKKASQSSYSQYSTKEGANGAINGRKTGRFGFHTNVEKNPWWQVDLENVYNLSTIVVYNRLDSCSDRSDTIKVLISVDRLNWKLIYEHKNRLTFGGVRLLNGAPPLLIELSKVSAQFVKLECAATTIFHLDEIEIYSE
jgi:hypothetical protein